MKAGFFAIFMILGSNSGNLALKTMFLTAVLYYIPVLNIRIIIAWELIKGKPYAFSISVLHIVVGKDWSCLNFLLMHRELVSHSITFKN